MPAGADDKPPECLLALQRRFADHIRNPGACDAPEGLEDRRMAIYRRLFRNNLSGLFAGNFPVLRRLLDDETWKALIRQFMTEQRPVTPMFTQIGREFVRFIEERRPEVLPPFAFELAHWEYLETVVRLHHADPGGAAVEAHGDLLTGVPVLNPTLQVAEYRWPVHQIGPDYTPGEPLETPLLLAVFRRRDDRTSFMRINAMTAGLLGLLEGPDAPAGRDALERVAGEIGADDSAAVVEAGEKLLRQLHQAEVVLGVQAA